MKDPKPLLREGASDFERQLLGAVMRERPSPQLRSRMRHTLGLTGPIAWASSVKAMLSALAGNLAGKGAISVAVVGLVAAGAVGVRSMQSEADAALAVREADPVVTLTPAVAPPTPVAAPALEAPALEAPAPEQAQRAAPEQTVGNRELREEILLLDQVRAALQSGSGAAASEQLDVYRQRFPSGILSREAAQLRQQAGTAARAHSKAPGSTPRSH